MVSPYELQKFDSSPIRTLTVLVPANSREKFISRLKKFAEVNGFSQRIKPIHPVDPQFGIDLWRDDIGIFGDNLHGDIEFSLGFYPNKSTPISEVAADGIVESLIKEISNVAGVTSSVVNH